MLCLTFQKATFGGLQSGFASQLTLNIACIDRKAFRRKYGRRPAPKPKAVRQMARQFEQNGPISHLSLSLLTSYKYSRAIINPQNTNYGFMDKIIASQAVNKQDHRY